MSIQLLDQDLHLLNPVEEPGVQLFAFWSQLRQCTAAISGILCAFCQASLHKPVYEMPTCR